MKTTDEIVSGLFLFIEIVFIAWTGAVSYYSEIEWIGESYIFSLCIFLLFILVFSYAVFFGKELNRETLNPLPWVVIAIFILLIYTSIVKYDAVFETYRIISPMLLFFITLNIVKTERLKKLALYAFVGVGLFWGILSYIKFCQNTGVLSSIWGYQNTFAAFLVLMIFLSLGIYLKEKNRNVKTMLSLVPIFLIFLLYLTVSRGGYIAFFVSLIVFLIVLKNKKKVFKELILVAIAALLLIAVAAPKDITLAVFRKGKVLKNYIEGVPNMSLAMRVYFIKLSTKIFLKRPFTGFGLGSYRYMFTKFNRVDPFFRIDPHSLFFKLLVETGILGTGAFFTFLGYYLLRAFLIINKKDAIYKGLFAGFVGMLFHMCIDVDVYPIMFIILFFSLTLLVELQFVKIHKAWRVAISVPVLIAVVVVIFNLFPKSVAAHYAMEGEGFTFKTVENSVKNLEKSIEKDPHCAAYYGKLGLSYMAKGDLEEAKKQFIRAYELNKFDYRFPLYVGKILLAEGKSREATGYLGESEKLYPFCRDILSYSAVCYAMDNDFVEAEKYLSKEKEYFKGSDSFAEVVISYKESHNKSVLLRELSRLKFYVSTAKKFNDVRRSYYDEFIQMKILENLINKSPRMGA